MRTDRDTYLMDLARRAASQTTCARRGVGCVLADVRGRVLAIAYNGVACGQPHCNEGRTQRLNPELIIGRRVKGGVLRPVLREADMKAGERVTVYHYPNGCEGWDLPPGQDKCEAVHAEQNALVQCARPDEIHTAYVTLAPCPNCTKLLLNTGCRRILVAENHQGKTGLDLWQKAGREWLRPMAPAG